MSNQQDYQMPAGQQNYYPLGTPPYHALSAMASGRDVGVGSWGFGYNPTPPAHQHYYQQPYHQQQGLNNSYSPLQQHGQQHGAPMGMGDLFGQVSNSHSQQQQHMPSYNVFDYSPHQWSPAVVVNHDPRPNKQQHMAAPVDYYNRTPGYNLDSAYGSSGSGTTIGDLDRRLGAISFSDPAANGMGGLPPQIIDSGFGQVFGPTPTGPPPAPKPVTWADRVKQPATTMTNTGGKPKRVSIGTVSGRAKEFGVGVVTLDSGQGNFWSSTNGVLASNSGGRSSVLPRSPSVAARISSSATNVNVATSQSGGKISTGHVVSTRKPPQFVSVSATDNVGDQLVKSRSHTNGILPKSGGSPPQGVDAENIEEDSPFLKELKKQTNQPEMTIVTKGARYFVIKSYSEDDIHRSIKYGFWCSTEHGNKRLDAAFKERCAVKGRVYLFFSVNASGHFCGVAEMVSDVDYDQQAGVWSQDRYKGLFKVRWIYVKDVPNGHLRHIRLENNENKPVTNSRDTQEVPQDKGRAVVRLIHQYKHTTSLFDDFGHYEKRQADEDSRKV